LWAYTDIPNSDEAKGGAESLYRFQELVQQLVSLERNAYRTPLARNASGTRLDTIQRELSRGNAQARRSDEAFESALPIEIPGPKDKRAEDRLAFGSLPEEDELSLGEFLHLELFDDGNGSQSLLDSAPPESSSGWKDILPMTVLLLASVVFSIVLTMVLGKVLRASSLRDLKADW
jgi:hypothetical protein